LLSRGRNPWLQAGKPPAWLSAERYPGGKTSIPQEWQLVARGQGFLDLWIRAPRRDAWFLMDKQRGRWDSGRRAVGGVGYRIGLICDAAVVFDRRQQTADRDSFPTLWFNTQRQVHI
jgi:hypothetical protein